MWMWFRGSEQMAWILKQQFASPSNVTIARPFIIFTLSRRTSTVAASGFDHAYGYLTKEAFALKVGIIEVVRTNPEYGIQIPSFLFRTVFDMTVWILLLTLQVADTNESASTQDETREDRCGSIKDRFHRILCTTGTKKRLEKTKLALYESELQRLGLHLQFEWDSKPQLISKFRKPFIIRKLCKQRYCRCFLQTKNLLPLPGFFHVQRICCWSSTLYAAKAISSLWSSNTLDLHNVCGRNDRAAWYTWAHELAEGTSYFSDASISAAWLGRFSQLSRLKRIVPYTLPPNSRLYDTDKIAWRFQEALPWLEYDDETMPGCSSQKLIDSARKVSYSTVALSRDTGILGQDVAWLDGITSDFQNETRYQLTSCTQRGWLELSKGRRASTRFKDKEDKDHWV